MIKNKKLYLVTYPDKETEYWHVSKNELLSELNRLNNIHNQNVIYSEITDKKIINRLY